MNIHKIRTEAEYRAALKEASALVGSDPALETPEGKGRNNLVGIVLAPLLTAPAQSSQVSKSIFDKPLPPELGDASMP